MSPSLLKALLRFKDKGIAFQLYQLPSLSVYGLGDVSGITQGAHSFKSLMSLPLAKPAAEIINITVLQSYAKLWDPVLAELLDTTQDLSAFLRMIHPSPGKTAQMIQARLPKCTQ